MSPALKLTGWTIVWIEYASIGTLNRAMPARTRKGTKPSSIRRSLRDHADALDGRRRVVIERVRPEIEGGVQLLGMLRILNAPDEGVGVR